MWHKNILIPPLIQHHIISEYHYTYINANIILYFYNLLPHITHHERTSLLSHLLSYNNTTHTTISYHILYLILTHFILPQDTGYISIIISNNLIDIIQYNIIFLLYLVDVNGVRMVGYGIFHNISSQLTSSMRSGLLDYYHNLIRIISLTVIF